LCSGGNTEDCVWCASDRPEEEWTDEAGSSSSAHAHSGVCGEAW